METFIYSGMESGTVTTTRSSLFKPVSNYQEILNEFENCYAAEDGKQQGDKLFWLASESNDGNSEAAIEFMTNHVEELNAAHFITILALPGQTISIQMTDLEFGNTETEMTT